MRQAHEGLSYRDFSGTEDLTLRTVCTKCGALAVDGLCDSTVQGNMTQAEYFVPGTEPTERCACHVAVDYCRESGQLAGEYCPAGQVETKVYLTSGTEGTADAEALVPEGEEVCQTHRNWWSWLFPEDRPEPEEPQEPETRPDGGWGGWWRDWFRF